MPFPSSGVSYVKSKFDKEQFITVVWPMYVTLDIGDKLPRLAESKMVQ